MPVLRSSHALQVLQSHKWNAQRVMRLRGWHGTSCRKMKLFLRKHSKPITSAVPTRRFFRQNNLLSIRPATLADISIIMTLASQSHTAAQWPREHYEQAIQIAQPRRMLLVLEEKNI